MKINFTFLFRKKCNINFYIILVTYYEYEDGINECFNLKRLSLFIENDLKDAIVIIFAEPSLKVIEVFYQYLILICLFLHIIQVVKLD